MTDKKDWSQKSMIVRKADTTFADQVIAESVKAEVHQKLAAATNHMAIEYWDFDNDVTLSIDIPSRQAEA